jgi:hypothetical protein
MEVFFSHDGQSTLKNGQATNLREAAGKSTCPATGCAGVHFVLMRE